ncbi:capsular biosynthesis protein [Peribacillus cavernae]|uniref:Capsular biosynthesis protein n=1 Tax=Peribacillus cavernae TaxID=1674310 RepID=A0A433HP49_9BACI|nr:Wzz/FepE/Etk N-terminal domain-containing protein [Peribacillus cavernae]MDQ0217500.1 capsular polysaccharide biosynthesis protein [Peribacillus cavernae]RUQ30060.1 capsular biosynthesis protein [Peribacillus cavernae]
MGGEKQQNSIENTKGKEINLKEYYEVIKKRLWIIILVTILTTSAGIFYNNLNNVPLYQTSTRIIIESDSENMKTLMVMIKDPIIMEKVKDELQLSGSSEGIAGQIVVERVDESKVVRISATDADPEMAANIVNTTAKVFKNEIVNILDFKGVRLLSEAKVNPNPINEAQNRTIIIALVFGIIAGIGLVFLLDSLDGTIKRESEVEDVLGVPVIGVIANLNKKKLFAKKIKQAELKLRGETLDIQ